MLRVVYRFYGSYSVAQKVGFVLLRLDTCWVRNISAFGEESLSLECDHWRTACLRATQLLRRLGIVEARFACEQHPVIRMFALSATRLRPMALHLCSQLSSFWAIVVWGNHAASFAVGTLSSASKSIAAAAFRIPWKQITLQRFDAVKNC